MFKPISRVTICAIAFALLPFSPAAADQAISTTECIPVSGLSVAGMPESVEKIRASITIENAVGALGVTTGLQSVAGWSGPSTKGANRFAFEGTVAQVNAGLESLKLRGVASGTASVSLLVTPAGAEYSSDTGHYYSATTGAFKTWNEARNLATSSVYNGLTGYLANVTSAAEVAILAGLGVGGWLGGSDAAKDGEWRWADGPEAGQLLTYTNWANGEPNNYFPEGEDSLEMKASTGTWNDARNIEPLVYAIVEYGGVGQALMDPVQQSLEVSVTEGSGEVYDQTACDPLPKDVVTKVVSLGSSTNAAEVDLEGLPQVSNPFDPALADAWAVFTGPSSQVVRTPFFWFRDYKSGAAVGEGNFRARFKPTERGDWTLTVSGKIGALTLDKVVPSRTITVDYAPPAQIEVKGTGFVRGGKPFTPVGYNIAWSRANSLADYDRWFKRASANGVNWARVWMASWGFGIEWKDTGLGDYSKRMDRARLLDGVFALASKYGINIDLVLLNHGAFSNTTNPEWKDNAYNVNNGGMLNSPEEFATSAEAEKFWQRRLRYIVARWGAQPSLASWEWWNEVDFTPIKAADLQAWILRSDAYLKTVDAYLHPTTTSWASGGSLRDWSAVDFASVHVYNEADPISTLGNLVSSMKQAVPGKPVLVAEMGSGAAGEDPTIDPVGLHMHNSQWAAVFAGFGAPAMYWWWDEYIDPLNLWSSTKGLVALMGKSDLAAMSARKFNGPAKTICQALVGEKQTLVWVRHQNYSRSARLKLLTEELIAALKEDRPVRKISDPVIKTAAFSVPVSGAGKYEVRLIDTRTGKLLRKYEARSKGKWLNVTTPKVTADIGLRVTRI